MGYGLCRCSDVGACWLVLAELPLPRHKSRVLASVNECVGKGNGYLPPTVPTTQNETGRDIVHTLANIGQCKCSRLVWALTTCGRSETNPKPYALKCFWRAARGYLGRGRRPSQQGRRPDLGCFVWRAAALLAATQDGKASPRTSRGRRGQPPIASKPRFGRGLGACLLGGYSCLYVIFWIC